MDAPATILKPSTDMYPVLHSVKNQIGVDIWMKKTYRKKPLRVFKLNDGSAEVEEQNSTTRGC